MYLYLALGLDWDLYPISKDFDLILDPDQAGRARIHNYRQCHLVTRFELNLRLLNLPKTLLKEDSTTGGKSTSIDTVAVAGTPDPGLPIYIKLFLSILVKISAISKF